MFVVADAKIKINKIWIVIFLYWSYFPWLAPGWNAFPIPIEESLRKKATMSIVSLHYSVYFTTSVQRAGKHDFLAPVGTKPPVSEIYQLSTRWHLQLEYTLHSVLWAAAVLNGWPIISNCYFAPGRGGNVLWLPCVCLSVCDHISGTTHPIFTKCLVHVACGRGSVLLWQHCGMLCKGKASPCSITERRVPVADPGSWQSACRWRES